MSIKAKYLIIFLTLLIVPQILLSSIVYVNNKEKLTDEGKIRLKNQTIMTIELIATLDSKVKEGVISLESAQEEIKLRILGPRKSDGSRNINENIDLGDNGYIFILNKQGDLVAHPNIEDSNVWDFNDINGVKFVQEIISNAQLSNGGFTYYHWELPDQTHIDAKIAYSAVDPYWGWVISSSSYLFEFNKPAESILWRSLITLFVFVCIDIVVVLILMNKLTKPILVLNESMQQLVSGNLETPKVDLSRKDEIGRINRTYVELVRVLSQLIHSFKKELNDQIVIDKEIAGSLADEMISIHEKTKERFRFYGRMFESTSEGIMITNVNGVIVDVNPAFSKVTGYVREEVVGKSSAILQSGKHDTQFFNEMWTSINESGQWRGEIWNKRKNGEIYAEWLTINAVKDDEGNLTNYVAIFTDLTKQKKAEETLRTLAHYDTLTGLPNRYSFNQKLEQALVEAGKSNSKVAVLFLDVDRFKFINDTLGHTIGDKLLHHISQRLEKCIFHEDIVSRLGGDEFTIILKKRFEQATIIEVIERVFESFKEPFVLDNHDMFVSVSIGVSVFPQDGINSEALIKNADIAMYKAKEEQGNTYAFYSPTMNHKFNQKMKLESALRRAIETEKLTIHYQPQFDIETKQLIGAEALIRWYHPEMGLISPIDFIPVAEETGLIVPLGQWVLKKACQQNKAWQATGYAPIKIAVNVSAFEFNNKKFVSHVKKALEETELDPQYLDLEITESISMYDYNFIISTLSEIKLLGVTLSIDDFGTGHSSLSYIKKFPIDYLKVDRSFIKDIARDVNNQAIVNSIISMSHGLNLKVVAEGIETEEEFELLSQYQCDIAQGYLLGKPTTVEEFEMLHLSKDEV